MINSGLRLNVLDLKGEISLEMNVLKFPEELLTLIETLKVKPLCDDNVKKKIKNIRLSRLNVIIEGLLEGCYANYVNINNLDTGWIFSYSDSNLSSIKHFLTLWAVDGGIEETIVKNIVKDLTYEKKTINISYKDILHKKSTVKNGDINNYLKHNLLLFHIGHMLSDKLKYNLPAIDGSTNELSFKKVNDMASNGKVRLMSQVLTNSYTMTKKKTKEVVTVFRSYAYFIDISIDIVHTEDAPKVYINSGLVRLRTKPNAFSTRGGKDINPYIEVPENMVLEGDISSYIKGKIIPRAYSWDSLFAKCFRYSYNILPNVKNIFASPNDYISGEGIKVYIPHGTHYWDAKHEILQGSDLYSRAEIAEITSKALKNLMPNIFDGDFVYVEKMSAKNKKNSHSMLTDISVPGDEINLEVYYINESFKSEFTKVIDAYNSGKIIVQPSKNASKEDKAEAKKNNDPIISSTEGIINILHPTKYKDAVDKCLDCVEGTYKIKVSFISLLEDMKLNFNIEDKVKKINMSKSKALQSNNDSDEQENKSAIEAEKKKAMREIEREISKNNRLFNKLKNDRNIIPAIVEFPDAEFFSTKDLIDLKNYMRHTFAKHNRVTQFFASGITTTKDVIDKSNYNRMAKCILECLRMKGIVIIDVDSPFEYTGQNDKNAIVGLYMVPGTEEFILTGLYKKKLYCYAVGVTKNWVDYSTMLTELGSTLDRSIKVNRDSVEEALRKFVECTGATHVVLMVNRTALKRKIPYFNDMKSDFNLSVKYKDDEDFEPKKICDSLLNRISLVTIDEEYSGLCPEWVAIAKGEEDIKSLPNSFYKMNDYVYYGIAPKTNSSGMKDLTKVRKEERLNKIFRKETAIMYTVPIVKDGYTTEFIARIAHNLRGSASFQYNFQEFTTLPYVLHLSKKAKEYLFKKSDLIYNESKQQDMDKDELNVINMIGSLDESNKEDIDIQLNGSSLLNDILNAEIVW